MIHMLDQAQLARTLFPVGDLTKADVRAEAARLGLRTATKPDSQDVCFITTTGGRAPVPRRQDPAHARSGGRPRPATRSVGSTPSSWSRSASARASASPAVVRRGSPCPSTSRPPPSSSAGADDLLTDSLRVERHGLGRRPGRRRCPRPVQRPRRPAPRRRRARSATPPSRSAGTDPQRRVAPGQSVVLYQGDEVRGRRPRRLTTTFREVFTRPAGRGFLHGTG